jgi:predicted ABC-type ATPase
MSSSPNLYIIAGPNGAGKTTFAEEFLPTYAKRSPFINADTIARGLSGFSPDAAALKAGRLLLEQIDAYASKKIDFAFETTLSGVTYASKFKILKEEGYRIHLFFLWIPDVKLSLARVARRVKMGGHDIAEKVVRRRFTKGLKNFFKLYQPLADLWILFDNSGNIPHRIATGAEGRKDVHDPELYNQVVEVIGEK